MLFTSISGRLWIALKFFVLLQSKQQEASALSLLSVVNCSQIFCTFAVETTFLSLLAERSSCELLSNFLYFCSRNNNMLVIICQSVVVNCSQIFCTFAVETTRISFPMTQEELWIALKFFVLLQSKQHVDEITKFIGSCELLSNFLYFCSRNNLRCRMERKQGVVNCSQIFCTFAVETTLMK